MSRRMLAFRWVVALAAILLMVVTAIAAVVRQESAPALEVLPWNGHQAAVSLTFDDGNPSQLDVAIPELNKYGFHGTFFLIANHLDRLDDWKKASAQGHEIGNHSLDHKHLWDLNGPEDERDRLGRWRVCSVVITLRHVPSTALGSRRSASG
jgi:peptidoglycan/xylan/chitin deacetylase (PgdA/CDA1 family)